MDLYYKSTRNSNLKVTASEAILKGLAPDGGLFVPEKLPVLGKSMEELKNLNYQDTAYEVMKCFLTDFTEEELRNCIEKAYDSKFDDEAIAPLVKVEDTYYLELFHGATIAFKDMALSILPHLMTTSAKKNQVKNEIVILTATSGDTGKAAMAGFADVEGTRIIVFYPKNGVSKVQELQMRTQKGANVDVVAIHGNFDNAQSGVKQMFEDQELAKEAGDLSKEIREAVEKYAIVAGEAKDFYAYEVDGFGQYNVMDDANLPSLLSMPYIGYCDKENERYQNTREMVLSERNPYYFPGKVLTGIGSPHTDTRYVWSMSLCMQGITSDDKEEKEAIFKMLENSDGGTNLMHESIFADDDTKYTRPWFSWANSVFCEFVMDYLGYSVKLH